MQVNRDFADLFAALNAAEARYLLVGGYAVALHAEPRFTKDLDIWIEASADNAARVHGALAAFGAPLSGISVLDFATLGNVVQIGIPPNRIDVATSLFRSSGKTHSSRTSAPLAGRRTFSTSNG